MVNTNLALHTVVYYRGAFEAIAMSSHVPASLFALQYFFR
jgi:hypothetical protein